jgi:hypothetical protein
VLVGVAILRVLYASRDHRHSHIIAAIRVIRRHQIILQLVRWNHNQYVVPRPFAAARPSPFPRKKRRLQKDPPSLVERYGVAILVVKMLAEVRPMPYMEVMTTYPSTGPVIYNGGTDALGLYRALGPMPTHRQQPVHRSYRTTHDLSILTLVKLWWPERKTAADGVRSASKHPHIQGALTR